MKASIGFTGTRYGMSAEQRARAIYTIQSIVQEIYGGPGGGELHHGDCIGADAECHRIARLLGLSVIVHPGPLDDRARQAGCVGDERRDPLRHMQRNAAIVRESAVMIAAPYEDSEQPRGGTWRTIGMARKAKRPPAIVWRDGRVDRERWP